MCVLKLTYCSGRLVLVSALIGAESYGAPGIYDVYQLRLTSDICRVIRQAGVVHRHLECLASGVEHIYQWQPKSVFHVCVLTGSHLAGMAKFSRHCQNKCL